MLVGIWFLVYGLFLSGSTPKKDFFREGGHTWTLQDHLLAPASWNAQNLTAWTLKETASKGLPEHMPRELHS